MAPRGWSCARAFYPWRNDLCYGKNGRPGTRETGFFGGIRSIPSWTETPFPFGASLSEAKRCEARSQILAVFLAFFWDRLGCLSFPLPLLRRFQSTAKSNCTSCANQDVPIVRCAFSLRIGLRIPFCICRYSYVHMNLAFRCARMSIKKKICMCDIYIYIYCSFSLWGVPGRCLACNS